MNSLCMHRERTWELPMAVAREPGGCEPHRACNCGGRGARLATVGVGEKLRSLPRWGEAGLAATEVGGKLVSLPLGGGGGAGASPAALLQRDGWGSLDPMGRDGSMFPHGLPDHCANVGWSEEPGSHNILLWVLLVFFYECHSWE